MAGTGLCCSTLPPVHVGLPNRVLRIKQRTRNRIGDTCARSCSGCEANLRTIMHTNLRTFVLRFGPALNVEGLDAATGPTGVSPARARALQAQAPHSTSSAGGSLPPWPEHWTGQSAARRCASFRRAEKTPADMYWSALPVAGAQPRPKAPERTCAATSWLRFVFAAAWPATAATGRGCRSGFQT
jgi:hypothetical protein